MRRNEHLMTDEFPYKLFARAKHESKAILECMKKLVLLASKHEDKLVACGFSPVRMDDGIALLTELKERLSIWGKEVELCRDENECLNAYIEQIADLTYEIHDAGFSIESCPAQYL